MRSQRAFAAYAWGVLAYTLLVILWGAFVRATGSGAGCGNHWPLCNGEVTPRAPSIETMIEFSHRLTSGLALLAAVVLVVWAWRAWPRGHRVRTGAMVSLIFLIIEALIGAGLVLLEYVADNVSVARAYWMAGHLINTFFLLGALTLTAWWAAGGAPLRLRGQGAVGWALGAALAGVVILGANGGVTALGDTLMLTAGISPDESPIVATLRDIRFLHPLLAFLVGGLVAVAVWRVNTQRPSPQATRWGRWVIGIYVAQLLLGALNVALRAPVWIQLAHLLLADLIWIGLVLLTAVALGQQALSIADESATHAPTKLRESPETS